MRVWYVYRSRALLWDWWMAGLSALRENVCRMVVSGAGFAHVLFVI